MGVKPTAKTSSKIRADLLMVERGLAESRERAQALIMEGVVFAPSGRVAKSGALLNSDVELDVRGRLPYVSRGGVKLAHALDEFGLNVTGLVALDVGASTGGFTDCLLQRGAREVVAIDAGYGQLAQRLRDDPRVEVRERTNARTLEPLDPPADLAVIDVSFISLTLVLPAVFGSLQGGADVLALVKPQFEAERSDVRRGGVVHDPTVHARVVGRVAAWAIDRGARVRGVVRSPLRGPAGNQEFFVWLRTPLGAPGGAV